MFITIIVMTTITSIVLLVLSVINFFKKLVKVMDETKLTTQDSSIDAKEAVLKICEDVFSNNDSASFSIMKWIFKDPCIIFEKCIFVFASF